MKQFLLTLITLTFTLGINAATFTTINDGDWNDINTWEGSKIPSIDSWPGDIIIINHNVKSDKPLEFFQRAGFTISDGGTLTVNGAVIAKGNGKFIIQEGGELNVSSFIYDSFGGSFTVLGNLNVDYVEKETPDNYGLMKIQGIGQMNFQGKVNALNLEITNGGFLKTTNAYIKLEENLTIDGGTIIKFNYSKVNIGMDFIKISGPSIDINYSDFVISGSVDSNGDVSLNLNQTNIQIGFRLNLQDDSKVAVDGESQIDAMSVILGGKSEIFGKGTGGWLMCNSGTIKDDAKIQCVSGECFYNAENYNNMPNTLDLTGFTNEQTNEELEAQGINLAKNTTNITGKLIGSKKATYPSKKPGIKSLPKTTSTSLEINVYPNPVIDQINVEGLDRLNNTKIILMNQLGQVVISNEVTENTNASIKVNQNLEYGIYSLVIQNGPNQVTKSIVVKGM